MLNLRKSIIENRTNSKPLTAKTLEIVDKKSTEFSQIQNWIQDVETLRKILSNYVIGSYNNNEQQAKDEIFTAYKKILSYFNAKTIENKLKAQYTDLNVLISISSNFAKKKDDNKKEFYTDGKIKFRKSLENFIADRLNKIERMTAEEIEAEAKAKREAKKARRQAEKAKANAKKETTKTTKKATKN